MARSTAGITKDGATPKPSPSAPEENPPEPAGYAEPTREEEDEPLPVVNVEETLGGPWGRWGNDRFRDFFGLEHGMMIWKRTDDQDISRSRHDASGVL